MPLPDSVYGLPQDQRAMLRQYGVPFSRLRSYQQPTPEDEAGWLAGYGKPMNLVREMLTTGSLRGVLEHLFGNCFTPFVETASMLYLPAFETFSRRAGQVLTENIYPGFGFSVRKGQRAVDYVVIENRTEPVDRAAFSKGFFDLIPRIEP
jgi:hypothetical protein